MYGTLFATLGNYQWLVILTALKFFRHVALGGQIEIFMFGILDSMVRFLRVQEVLFQIEVFR